MPSLGNKELNKLHRYCRRFLTQDGGPPGLEDTLRALDYYTSQRMLAEDTVDPGVAEEDNEELLRSDSAARPSSSSTSSSSASPYESTQPMVVADPSSAEEVDASHTQRHIDNYVPHGLHSPSTDATGLEECLNVSHAYYTSRLEQYAKRAHRSRASPDSAVFGVLEASQSADADASSVNKSFWHDLESAIYFMKTGKHHLVLPLLQRIGSLVPVLCVHQPMALLRNMFSVMSPKNTSFWPGLRETLMQLFTQSAYETAGPSHPLWQVFQCLWKSAVTDELCKTLLELMIRDCEHTLRPNDPELFQLKWAYTRFLRRSGDYANAAPHCLSLITAARRQFGNNHSNTRRAMSEMVYIYNDQGQYKEAVSIATDVIYLGKQNLGTSYPNGDCIYAMEDIAEVLKNVGGEGERRTSAEWLGKAYTSALKQWGADSAPTKNIAENLSALNLGHG